MLVPFLHAVCFALKIEEERTEQARLDARKDCLTTSFHFILQLALRKVHCITVKTFIVAGTERIQLHNNRTL